MKTNHLRFVAGMFLASVSLGLGQPVIIIQPQDQTPIQGASATFSVVATGTPPLTYQWRRYTNTTQFGEIAGATDATLTLSNVQPTSLRFGVVVSNPEGSVASVLARLLVLLPATITRQPIDQTAESGSLVRFSLTATGTPPLSVQWRFNSVDLPGQTSTNLALTNVQVSSSGNYLAVVTNVAGSSTSRVATLSVVPSFFTKITNGPVVTAGGNSVGVAWGDYDDDGYVDLFVANSGQPSFLFRNRGDGGFTRIENTPLNLSANSSAPAWADYDNDGDLDLFVAVGFNDTNNPANSADLLFRNEGGGSFLRITNDSVVTDTSGGFGAAWADFDNDGFLDLHVANTSGQPNFLYHNDGNGAFTRMTPAQVGPIASETGLSFGATWADYDNDGDSDLFVGNGLNGTENNSLYRNNGNGTFSKLTTNDVGSIVGDGGNSSPAAWGDYDNDGDLDVFVGNYDQPGFLYRNNGNGTFTRVEAGPITTDRQFAEGTVWGDFDNDGWLDLFVANGQDPAGDHNNSLYRNNGDGTFSKLLSTRPGSIVNDGGRSFGCGWADYDNDGFLDMFVANASGQNDFLYRNNGNSNHWLNLKLVGTRSNRSAIGAKVRVKATIRGSEMRQLREIASGSSYVSQQDLRAAFGLGDATNIDLIRIEWPSGTVQEMANVAANQFLTVTEPPVLRAVGKTPNGPFELQLTGGVGFRYCIETSSDLATWTPWLTFTNASRTTPLLDADAANASRRFYRAVSP